MVPDEDCRYVDTEGALPPEGVLGIHFTDEDGLEISFDPDRISDSQVADYARHLAPPRLERCLFRLQGRACEACALKIEDRTAALPGVRKASATFPGGTMSVSFDGAVTDQQKLLQIVLMGRPELKELLAREELRPERGSLLDMAFRSLEDKAGIESKR